VTGLTRAHVTLAYLVLVLLLGGAGAAGFSGNLLLQICGAVLIGWTIWERDNGPPLDTGLRRFGLALAVLMAVQFLPLPPALWQHLPGRDAVYQGFVTLGVEPPWLTVSLAPWKSLASFVWWIPALALFHSLRAEGGPLSRHVIFAIAAVASVSVAVGAMQRGAGTGYFYLITNYGEGPGFFANSNHQGSFLLAVLALWGGWLASERELIGGGRRGDGIIFALLGVGLLLLAGVLVSGSLACLALLVPVLAALVLIARPGIRLPPWLAIVVILVAVGGFLAFLLLGPVANDLTEKGTVAGISRQEFLFTGARILADFAPTGSGSGTFVELYRWYEDPAQVGTTFVNHAHNDLIEILIETGVFGLAVIAMFLIWFIPRAFAVWRGERGHAVALAASVVIAVELIHSLVDYPLRTAAMSSIMAIACVLLVRAPDPVRGRRSRRASAPDERREMIRI
jgi:O-antigen ligase